MGEEDERSKHRRRRHSHSHGHKYDDEIQHHKKKRQRDDDERDRRHRHHRHHRRRTSRHENRDENNHAKKNLASELEEDLLEDDIKDLASPAPAAKMDREAWMVDDRSGDGTDPFSSFLGAPKEKKPIEKVNREGLFISVRELNKTAFQAQGAISESEDDVEYNAPNYTIGDSGSSWRMMKLKNLYAAAKESMRPVEELAIERMGSLQAYDDAREEEMELERRKRDYRNEGVMKVKVTGELYRQRLANEKKKTLPQKRHLQATQPLNITSNEPPITQSDLNKLQATLLRAQMTSSLEAPKLAAEYDAAVKRFNNQESLTTVVNLPAAHSKLVPHLSREASKSSMDMTIEDMVKEERASKRFATVDRIARDRGFKNDLEYMDENAERLAAMPKRRESALKSMSVQEYKKQEQIVTNCPLCYKDDGKAPLAPVVSLATRVYLSLPTDPELTSDGAIIVPLRHARNLVECDDDEWEEIRNFMKCLIQMYSQRDLSVLFYEDASHPSLHRHPALVAVPMSHQQFAQAPAYFTQALNSAESEWATHRPIIDTNDPALGKWGFRKRIAKEAPYFHVWFSLEGGMGHVVEDAERWGNGELWVRSVLGSGLLDIDRSIWGKMGRWTGYDKRLDRFRRKWDRFDWTKALADG